MRVLWPHTFSPAAKHAGVFMFQLVEPLKKQGVEAIPLYIGGIKRNPRAFFAALPEMLCLAKSCDIIHAQYGSMCGLIAGFFPGRKVLSLRGSDWYRITGGGMKLSWHSFLARSMTRLSLLFYRHVVVMSKRMRQSIQQKYPRLNISAIPDGVDLAHFQPMDKRTARRQLGLDENLSYALFITAYRENPIKRIWLAEAAVEIARKIRPDVRMLVAENIDHEQMPAYIGASNLVINSSTHEGWPNSIKEALACNVPFVATDVSDLGEIAVRTLSCKVVDANPEALAGAILDSLDTAEAANLRDFVQPMAIDNCAQELKALYGKLIKPV